MAATRNEIAEVATPLTRHATAEERDRRPSRTSRQSHAASTRQHQDRCGLLEGVRDQQQRHDPPRASQREQQPAHRDQRDRAGVDEDRRGEEERVPTDREQESDQGDGAGANALGPEGEHDRPGRDQGHGQVDQGERHRLVEGQLGRQPRQRRAAGERRQQTGDVQVLPRRPGEEVDHGQVLLLIDRDRRDGSPRRRGVRPDVLGAVLADHPLLDRLAAFEGDPRPVEPGEAHRCDDQQAQAAHERDLHRGGAGDRLRCRCAARHVPPSRRI